VPVEKYSKAVSVPSTNFAEKVYVSKTKKVKNFGKIMG